ncbi:MAG: glycosyltransferase [Fusobacteriaceae bacterium]|jgi:glycosyltransferase involved in cell wall biosynthesis|nr:glycosyltransferase [Fusobacteriaceae bacterium]
MRVLQVINNLGSGGAEKLVNDCSIKMNDIGIDIEIAVLEEKGSIYINDLIEKNIKIHILSIDKIYSLITFIKLFMLLKKGKYSIVHAHIFPTFYYVGILSLFFNNVNFIYTEHNTNNRRRLYKFFKIIEKFMYSRYKMIICISEKTKTNLREYINDHSKKIKTIHNGIDLEKYINSIPVERRNLNLLLTYEDKIVTMVGRFSHQKDQITLIKAINILPETYKLLLIGEGELKNKTIEFVNDIKLSDRVFFLGLRKDVPNILKSSDIVVLSSRWEGFGLAALEGMASKVPTIVSDVEGMKEIINNQNILFEVGNAESLAKKIKEISENKEFYHKIAKLGFERSLLFSLDSMVKGYIKIYNNFN